MKKLFIPLIMLSIMATACSHSNLEIKREVATATALDPPLKIE